jgi:hypothetical protein
MAERQIASIAEGVGTGHVHYVLTYSDGETENRDGSLVDASELARSSGLSLVHTTDESILWKRDPDAPRSA